MSALPLIDPSRIKELIINESKFIDVRSPNEFSKGSVTNAVNMPILSDQDRHEVGICFQNKGQDAAIELGNKLVTGVKKKQIVTNWSEFIRNNPNSIIYCARGGLRSQICQEWLKENRMVCPRLEGGYKSIRNFLLDELNKICKSQNIFLLSGMTGSGKTQLIQKHHRAIDLEGIANHKGSSFGKPLDSQPAQIDIENLICVNFMKLLNENSHPILLEDESRNIGARHLPLELSNKMSDSPMVLIDATFDERINLLWKEYIVDRYQETKNFFLDDEKANVEFSLHLTGSLKRLEKRLGGERTRKILSLLENALRTQADDNFESHRIWLREITKLYYDPLYKFKLEKKKSRIVFRGSKEEVFNWLQHHT